MYTGIMNLKEESQIKNITREQLDKLIQRSLIVLKTIKVEIQGGFDLADPDGVALNSDECFLYDVMVDEVDLDGEDIDVEVIG